MQYSLFDRVWFENGRRIRHSGDVTARLLRWELGSYVVDFHLDRG